MHIILISSDDFAQPIEPVPSDRPCSFQTQALADGCYGQQGCGPHGRRSRHLASVHVVGFRPMDCLQHHGTSFPTYQSLGPKNPLPSHEMGHSELVAASMMQDGRA